MCIHSQLTTQLPGAQRPDVEEVVIGDSHIAIAGLTQVEDIVEFLPEMAEDSVHGFAQSVGHFWMLAPPAKGMSLSGASACRTRDSNTRTQGARVIRWDTNRNQADAQNATVRLDDTLHDDGGNLAGSNRCGTKSHQAILVVFNIVLS